MDIKSLTIQQRQALLNEIAKKALINAKFKELKQQSLDEGKLKVAHSKSQNLDPMLGLKLHNLNRIKRPEQTLSRTSDIIDTFGTDKIPLELDDRIIAFINENFNGNELDSLVTNLKPETLDQIETALQNQDTITEDVAGVIENLIEKDYVKGKVKRDDNDYDFYQKMVTRNQTAIENLNSKKEELKAKNSPKFYIEEIDTEIQKKRNELELAKYYVSEIESRQKVYQDFLEKPVTIDSYRAEKQLLEHKAKIEKLKVDTVFDLVKNALIKDKIKQIEFVIENKDLIKSSYERPNDDHYGLEKYITMLNFVLGEDGTEISEDEKKLKIREFAEQAITKKTIDTVINGLNQFEIQQILKNDENISKNIVTNELITKINTYLDSINIKENLRDENRSADSLRAALEYETKLQETIKKQREKEEKAREKEQKRIEKEQKALQKQQEKEAKQEEQRLKTIEEQKLKRDQDVKSGKISPMERDAYNMLSELENKRRELLPAILSKYSSYVMFDDTLYPNSRDAKRGFENGGYRFSREIDNIQDNTGLKNYIVSQIQELISLEDEIAKAKQFIVRGSDDPKYIAKINEYNTAKENKDIELSRQKKLEETKQKLEEKKQVDKQKLEEKKQLDKEKKQNEKLAILKQDIFSEKVQKMLEKINEELVEYTILKEEEEEINAKKPLTNEDKARLSEIKDRTTVLLSTVKDLDIAHEVYKDRIAFNIKTNNESIKDKLDKLNSDFRDGKISKLSYYKQKLRTENETYTVRRLERISGSKLSEPLLNYLKNLNTDNEHKDYIDPVIKAYIDGKDLNTLDQLAKENYDELINRERAKRQIDETVNNIVYDKSLISDIYSKFNKYKIGGDRLPIPVVTTDYSILDENFNTTDVFDKYNENLTEEEKQIYLKYYQEIQKDITKLKELKETYSKYTNENTFKELQENELSQVSHKIQKEKTEDDKKRLSPKFREALKLKNELSINSDQQFFIRSNGDGTEKFYLVFNDNETGWMKFDANGKAYMIPKGKEYTKIFKNYPYMEQEANKKIENYNIALAKLKSLYEKSPILRDQIDAYVQLPIASQKVFSDTGYKTDLYTKYEPEKTKAIQTETQQNDKAIPKNIAERLKTLDKKRELKKEITSIKEKELNIQKSNIDRETQNEIENIKQRNAQVKTKLDIDFQTKRDELLASIDKSKKVQTLEELNAKKIDAQKRFELSREKYDEKETSKLRKEMLDAQRALREIEDEIFKVRTTPPEKPKTDKEIEKEKKQLDSKIKDLSSKYEDDLVKLKLLTETSIQDAEKKGEDKKSNLKINTDEIDAYVNEKIAEDKLKKQENIAQLDKEKKLAQKDTRPFVFQNQYLQRILTGDQKLVNGLKSDTPTFDSKKTYHNLFNVYDFPNKEMDSKTARKNGIWIKLPNENVHIKVHNGNIIAVYGDVTPQLAYDIKANNKQVAKMIYNEKVFDRATRLEQSKIERKIKELNERGITETSDGKPITLDNIKSIDELPKKEYTRQNETRETQLKRFNRKEVIDGTVVVTKLNADGTREIKDVISNAKTKKEKDDIKKLRITQLDMIKNKDLAYRGEKNEDDQKTSKGKYHKIKYNIDGKELELNVKLEHYTPKEKSFYKLEEYHRPIDMDEESRKKLIIALGISNERELKAAVDKVYQSKGDHPLLDLAEQSKDRNKAILDTEQVTSKYAMQMLQYDMYKGKVPKKMSAENAQRLLELHDKFMRRAKTQGKFMTRTDESVLADPFLNQDLASIDLTKNVEYKDDIDKTLGQLPYNVKMYKGLVIDVDIGKNKVPVNKAELIKQTQAIVTKHYYHMLGNPIEQEIVKSAPVNSKELENMTTKSLQVFIKHAGNTYIDLRDSSETLPREQKDVRLKPDDYLRQFKDDLDRKTKEFQDEQDAKLKEFSEKRREEEALQEKLRQQEKKKNNMRAIAGKLGNRIQSNNQSIRSKLMQSSDILAEISKLPIDSKKIPILKARKKQIDAQVLRQKTENEIFSLKLERYVDIIKSNSSIPKEGSISSENMEKFKKLDKARKILQYQNQTEDVNTLNNDFQDKLDKIAKLESMLYGVPTGKFDKNNKAIYTLGLEAQVKQLQYNYQQKLEDVSNAYSDFLIETLDNDRNTSKASKLTSKQRNALENNEPIDLSNTSQLYQVKLSIIASIKKLENSLKDQVEKNASKKSKIEETIATLKREKNTLEEDLRDVTNGDERLEIEDKIKKLQRSISNEQNDLSSLDVNIKNTQGNIIAKKNLLAELSYTDLRQEVVNAQKELENAKKTLRNLSDEVIASTKGMTLEEAKKVYNELKDERVNGVSLGSIKDTKQAISLLTTNVSSKEHLVEMARRHKLKNASNTAIATNIELARKRNETKLEQFKMLEHAQKLVALYQTSDTQRLNELDRKSLDINDKIKTIRAVYDELIMDKQFRMVGDLKIINRSSEEKLLAKIMPYLSKAEQDAYFETRMKNPISPFEYFKPYLDNMEKEYKSIQTERETLLSKEINPDASKDELRLSYKDALYIVQYVGKYKSEEEILLEDTEFRKSLENEIKDSQQDIKNIVYDLNQSYRDNITIDALIRRQQISDHRNTIEKVMQSFEREKQNMMLKYEQEQIKIAEIIREKALQQKSLTDKVVKELRASDQSPISSLTNMIETGLNTEMVLNAIKASSSDKSTSAGFIDTVKKAGIGKDKKDTIDDDVGKPAPIRFSDKQKKADGQSIQDFRNKFLNSLFTQILAKHIPTKPEEIEAFKVFNGIDVPTQDIIDNIEKYKQAMIYQFLEVQNTLSTEKRAKDGKGDPSWKATSDDVKNSMSMFTNKFFMDVSDQAAELQKTEGTKYSQDPVENQNMLLAELLEKRLKTHIEQFFNPKIDQNPPKLNVNAEYDSIMEQLFTHSKDSDGFQKLSDIVNNTVDEKAEIKQEIDKLQQQADEAIKNLMEEKEKRRLQLISQFEELYKEEEETKAKKIREKAIEDYRKYVLKSNVIPNQTYSLTNTLYKLIENSKIRPEFRNVSMNMAYLSNIKTVGQQLVNMNNVLMDKYFKLYMEDAEYQDTKTMTVRPMTVDDLKNEIKITSKSANARLFQEILRKKIYDPRYGYLEPTVVTYSKNTFDSIIKENTKNAETIKPVITETLSKQYDLAKEQHKGIMGLLQLYGDNAGTMNYVDMQYLELANQKLKSLSDDVYNKMFAKVLGIYTTIPTISPEIAIKLANISMQKIMDKIISSDIHELTRLDSGIDIVDTIYNTLRTEDIYLAENDKDVHDMYLETEKLIKQMGKDGIPFRDIFDDPTLLDDVLDISKEFWVDSIDSDLNYLPETADQAELKRLLRAYQSIVNNNDFNSEKTKEFFKESSDKYVEHMISYLDDTLIDVINDPTMSNGSQQSQHVKDVVYNNQTNTQTFSYDGKEYTLGNVTDDPNGFNPSNGETFVAEPDKMSDFINKSINISTMTGVKGFSELTNTLFSIIDCGIPADQMETAIKNSCKEYMKTTINNIVETHRDLIRGTILHNLAKFNKTYSKEYVDQLVNKYTLQLIQDAQEKIIPRVSEFTTNVADYMINLSYSQSTLGTEQANLDRVASKQDFLRKFLLGEKGSNQPSLVDLFKNPTDTSSLPQTLRSQNLMSEFITQITNEIYDNENVEIVKWKLSPIHKWQGGNEICEKFAMTHDLPQDIVDKLKKQGVELSGVRMRSNTPRQLHPNCMCYTVPIYIK